MASTQPIDNWILYDGECPFCSNYVKLLRLREAIGDVRLIDAREPSPERDEVYSAGLSLDEGMALRLNGRLYHGAECIHRLSLLSTDTDWFNRLNAAVFKSERLSLLLYPILRAGRNSTLRLLGRKPIETV